MSYDWGQVGLHGPEYDEAISRAVKILRENNVADEIADICSPAPLLTFVLGEKPRGGG